MNSHARHLFCTLQALFSSHHHQASFRALIALFLRGDGHPHLRHATTKSASALSRFLNTYDWSCTSLIRHTRHAATRSLLEYYQHQRGRRPRLRVMIDLTTLEKTGSFSALGRMHVLNRRRGLHVVVMYLQAGPLRFPWALRVWRGKGEASVSEIALVLLRSLPEVLTTRFRVLVLADGGFGNNAFLEGVHELGLDAVVGIRRDRLLEDGRSIGKVRSGERVTPTELSFPVTVGRYWLKRETTRERRVVVATFSASGRIISRWGRRRWRIEAFFKTAKSRFGLARFGQSTARGVYRFLVLSLLSFVLSQWGAWSTPAGSWPDWRMIACVVRRSLLPEVVQAELLAELALLRPYLEAAGVPLGT